jgi:Flp pilus assembly protein TadD
MNPSSLSRTARVSTEPSEVPVDPQPNFGVILSPCALRSSRGNNATPKDRPPARENDMNWERFGELVTLSESGQTEEAICGLRQLLVPSESHEDQATVLLIIGACQEELGRFGEARRSLAGARSLADKNSGIHPRALFFEARMDARERDWKQTLGKLEEIIQGYSSILHQPEREDLYEEVRRYRGMALYELDRPNEALPLLKEAAKVEYEKPAALYYLGRCCYDLGDLEGAKEHLRAALTLQLHPTYQPSAHYMLGLSYRWCGQYAWAIHEYEWCLENDTQQLVARWKVLDALARASKALGLESEADRYSRMLRELGPDRPEDVRARSCDLIPPRA